MTSASQDVHRLDQISRTRCLTAAESDELWRAMRRDQREQIRAQAPPPGPRRGKKR